MGQVESSRDRSIQVCQVSTRQYSRIYKERKLLGQGETLLGRHKLSFHQGPDDTAGGAVDKGPGAEGGCAVGHFRRTGGDDESPGLSSAQHAYWSCILNTR